MMLAELRMRDDAIRIEDEGWCYQNFVRDTAEWLQDLTANTKVAAVLGSSDTVESEGRQNKRVQ